MSRLKALICIKPAGSRPGGAGSDPEPQPFQPPDFEAGNAFARVDRNSDFPSCLQIMRKAAAAMKNYIAISMI